MPIRELTAVLTHRYSAYAYLLIALVLAAGFLYAFNFTPFFGGVTQ